MSICSWLVRLFIRIKAIAPVGEGVILQPGKGVSLF